MLNEFDYLSKLSGGDYFFSGLGSLWTHCSFSGLGSLGYVSKSLAMLDTANDAILKSAMGERVTGEEVSTRNT